MRIINIADLPDVAQRSEWARILKCDSTTLYRAEREKSLRRSKPTGKLVLYTKKEILRWLAVD